MHRLRDYQGWAGRYHEIRDSAKQWMDNKPNFDFNEFIRRLRISSYDSTDFAHLYRKKSRWDLIRISAAVMGIEFSYAAETAFVSPTLLKIGVKHQKMTLVWALSPLVGFFLCPFLGSLSDNCRHKMGRRRPFIILLSIGVLLGLLLVPNGEYFGYKFGDTHDTTVEIVPDNINATTNIPFERDFNSSLEVSTEVETIKGQHSWGILFTIIGTILLDFDADACQSPSRAYLLDITVPEDNAKGLSTFTIMAGVGGFLGYSLGAIDWDSTFIGELFGGHVRAVFSLVTVIFIICVSVTITSFAEIPLPLLEELQLNEPEAEEPNSKGLLPPSEITSLKRHSEVVSLSRDLQTENNYGALPRSSSDTLDVRPETHRPTISVTIPNGPEQETIDKTTGERGLIGETSFTNNNQANGNIEFPQIPSGAAKEQSLDGVSLGYYLRSIVFMPTSLRLVCLTNLFCWMAHVCYSLYFTDFVGESVYGGDPRAPVGSVLQLTYEEGVRFGCWGMAMYSLSCACYSLIIERLIEKYGARNVYVGGLCFYSAGMSLMAMTRYKMSVIVFSWTAGVMYSTLFTMPYLLVANYHNKGVFAINGAVTEHRGLGTDVAIVSSMVFLAQFILSLCMGTIISWTGTTTAVVSVAAFLSLCGAISATQILYLDL